MATIETARATLPVTIPLAMLTIRAMTSQRTTTWPWPLGEWLRGIRPRILRKNPLADHGDTASLPEAVRENEEVVPVNTVLTWVLPSGVTVGR